MAGRNDRRRSNELRPQDGGSRAGRIPRSAGTSRPIGGSARSSRTTRTSRVDSRGQVSSARGKSSRQARRQSSSVSVQAGSPATHARNRGSQSPTVEARRGGRALGSENAPHLVSTSVGELRRAKRREQAKSKSRKYVIRTVVVLGIVIAVLAGWAVLYNSPAFTIENVEVNGVEHLTSEEMAQLANVPADTTLLRVDTATIKRRIEQNAWVADAQVNLVFPGTLQINVTERSVFAVVEIPVSGGSSVKQWAISDDHLWLMPIPEAGSEAAKTTSSRVYEDAENALHIVDVPIGTKAEIGVECTDANVNNALDVIAGLTTELKDRVAKVSAAGTAETTLVLDSGVEVAFGAAEDIRDKERVVLQILQDNPNNVAYINVRIVDSPTWRAV